MLIVFTFVEVLQWFIGFEEAYKYFWYNERWFSGIFMCECVCLAWKDLSLFILEALIVNLFFFFLISNENFIKKRKTANPSTLRMYYGGTNQWPRLQRSSKAKREEQEKWQKTTLQSRRVCRKKKKKKNLISNIKCSHPSKLLAFLSRQIHHNKQWGTILHNSMFLCCPNIPYQDSNNSITLWGITQWTPNKQNTNNHISQAMGQWRRRWSTDSPQFLHI